MSESTSSEGPEAVAVPVSAPVGDGLAHTVASHYNNLEAGGRERRQESSIIHMRNLNNWIKSQLINQYVKKVEVKQNERGRRRSLHILDLGCGKGGDLLKWQKSNVNHIACCDIAETSIEQAQDRYDQFRHRNRGRIFSAEFHVADCTRERLSEMYKDPEQMFDITSCQFAFHYCFESLPQAERMIQNASERLKPGGFFIGTTPDAYDLISRAREPGLEKFTGPDGTEKVKFGNSIYSVTVPAEWADENHEIPLFGAKYDFHLDQVVNCPEFLVHFPTLTKLAEKSGLILVAKRRFANFFEEFKRPDMEGERLLMKMRALETFSGGDSMDTETKSNYQHAIEASRKISDEQNLNHPPTVGTLSRKEWEAASIYIIFAFLKL
eukprot:maker-scaffold224_size251237-snap-gene-1.41 protein:Tk05442 transcript:maker-scaffold224_size251237-snap-gene-1.41-mRNA-1 annotation:"mrna cap guanine-n7 methyltransferase"